MTPKQKRSHKRNYAIMRLCRAISAVNSILYQIDGTSIRSRLTIEHLNNARRSLNNSVASIRISTYDDLYKE